MTQLASLFDFVDMNGLNLRNLQVQVDLWSARKIQSFVEAASSLIASEDQNQSTPFTGVFNFEANADLSGGLEWCSSPMCRLRKIDELARFAALYSDKVFIANPFDHYSDLDPSSYEDPDLQRTKRFFVGDIAILLYLRPLFEANLIHLRTSPSHICFDCINKVIEPNSDIKKAIGALEEELRSIYYREPHYFFRNEKEFYSCKAVGSEYLIEHGEINLSYSKTQRPELKTIAKSLGKKEVEKAFSRGITASRNG